MESYEKFNKYFFSEKLRKDTGKFMKVWALAKFRKLIDSDEITCWYSRIHFEKLSHKSYNTYNQLLFVSESFGKVLKDNDRYWLSDNIYGKIQLAHDFSKFILERVAVMCFHRAWIYASILTWFISALMLTLPYKMFLLSCISAHGFDEGTTRWVSLKTGSIIYHFSMKPTNVSCVLV